MASATMTADGRFTMPKAVRERLRLKTGDRIDFVEVNGQFWVVPHDWRAVSLAGILGNPLGRVVTIEEMDQGIADALGEDDARITREWNEGRK